MTDVFPPTLSPDVTPPVPPAPEKSAGGWWRTVVCVVVAILAAVLVTAGAVGQWAQTEVVSTSGFTNAVGPLSSHPGVKAAMTDAVTERVMTVLENSADSSPIGAMVLKALLPSLRAPLRQGVETAVASDTVGKLWDNTMTSVHDETMASINGTSQSVDFNNGTATINLNDFKASLVGGFEAPDALKTWAQGLDLGTITVNTGASEKSLDAAVKIASAWLPILLVGIVLVALAGLVARRTGFGLIIAGAAIAIIAAIALVVGGKGFTTTTQTDALSIALGKAIMGSLQPGFTQNMLYAVGSGIAVALVGAGVWLVGRRA